MMVCHLKRMLSEVKVVLPTELTISAAAKASATVSLPHASSTQLQDVACHKDLLPLHPESCQVPSLVSSRIFQICHAWCAGNASQVFGDVKRSRLSRLAGALPVLWLYFEISRCGVLLWFGVSRESGAVLHLHHPFICSCAHAFV